MTPRYKIGERIDVPVIRTSGEPNFDRACEMAYKMAIAMFGLTDDGHFSNVKDSDRSTVFIIVEFKRYRHCGGMCGQTCEYIFEAWVARDEDE